MKKNSNKREVVLLSLILFNIIILSPLAISHDVNIKVNEKGYLCIGLFQSKGDIKFDYNAHDFHDPIEPSTGVYPKRMNVSYRVVGVSAHITARLFRQMPVPITLSIEDKPEWAVVSIIPENIWANINTEWKAELFYLMVGVTDKAPAFTPGKITIKGDASPIKGPLGLLTFIQGTTRSNEVAITPGYLGRINVTIDNNTIYTPPDTNVDVPITILNWGNARTTINSKIVQIPSSEWHIELDNETITLDVAENGTIVLQMKAPSNFTGTDEIIIECSSHYFANPEITGETIQIPIIVYYNPL